MLAEWGPRALLFDVPKCEPEELSHIHVGAQPIDLWWVIPIYRGEYDLIREKGLEAFEELDEASEWSLADVDRPPLVGEE